MVLWLFHLVTSNLNYAYKEVIQTLLWLIFTLFFAENTYEMIETEYVKITVDNKSVEFIAFYIHHSQNKSYYSVYILYSVRKF